MQALKLFIKHHIECREGISWFNNNQSHYFRQYFQLTYRLERRVLPTRGHSLCISHHNQYYAVFTNLQTGSSFSFHLPACFFIYTCVPFIPSFTQICFGFLKKTLWFFLMVFDGKPTASISEPTSVQRLLYIKTNDPKIDPNWSCSFDIPKINAEIYYWNLNATNIDSFYGYLSLYVVCVVFPFKSFLSVLIAFHRNDSVWV